MHIETRLINSEKKSSEICALLEDKVTQQIPPLKKYAVKVIKKQNIMERTLRVLRSKQIRDAQVIFTLKSSLVTNSAKLMSMEHKFSVCSQLMADQKSMQKTIVGIQEQQQADHNLIITSASLLNRVEADLQSLNETVAVDQREKVLSSGVSVGIQCGQPFPQRPRSRCQPSFSAPSPRVPVYKTPSRPCHSPVPLQRTSAASALQALSKHLATNADIIDSADNPSIRVAGQLLHLKHSASLGEAEYYRAMLELNRTIVSVYSKTHSHDSMAEICRDTNGPQACQRRLFHSVFRQWRSAKRQIASAVLSPVTPIKPLDTSVTGAPPLLRESFGHAAATIDSIASHLSPHFDKLVKSVSPKVAGLSSTLTSLWSAGSQRLQRGGVSFRDSNSVLSSPQISQQNVQNANGGTEIGDLN
jgi:hypothetical protein